MVVTAWASRAFPSRTPALASVRPLTISATGPKASRALVVAARPEGAASAATSWRSISPVTGPPSGKWP